MLLTLMAIINGVVAVGAAVAAVTDAGCPED